MNPQAITSILVWGPNWLGDIVLGIPAVRALKKQFPSSRLVYVVPSPLGEILSKEKGIDQLVQRDPSDGTSSSFSFLLRLRRERFDLGIALPNSFRAGLMLYLSGAKKRVGYGSDGRGLLLTDPLPAKKRNEEGHRVDYFLELAVRAGCRNPDKNLFLEIEEEERKKAEKLLAEHGIESGELLIGLHPGASKPPRTLAPRKFSEICRTLIQRWDAKVLLFGSAREENLLHEVQGGANNEKVVVLQTSPSLRMMAALLERCGYFIGCDSGLMHLAAAVGTPVVGIFGPGVPEHTGPACQEDKKAVIFHRFPCAPCRQRYFKDCNPSPEGRPPCIEKVRVEEILEGVEKLMEGRTARK